MFIYALTILVSAFLLFQVQPVIAKIILPWFGGSAAVWTVCLLFFQVVLLLGYLYAHASVRYLKPRVQMVLHLALLAVTLLVLPIYPAARLKPSGTEDPTFGILALLAVTVGLPYFLLSTTGPLLQAWYARRFKNSMPYRLYALSNAGSLFALISYPVLFEPVFGVHRQAANWSAAYLLFIALCAWTALRSGNAQEVAAHQEEDPGPKPGLRQYVLWLVLPACASVLLLATTNHLSQNVAAIPFLWVLPLSIYLLTFILCFEGSGWYRRFPYIGLFAVAVGSMAYAIGIDFTGNMPIKLLLPLFSLGLFTCCMVCHGELVKMKPHPHYLTQFYLMISAGGALGGIFVGLVAPHIFSSYWELPLGLVVVFATVVVVLKLDPEADWFQEWYQPGPLAGVILTVALAVYIGLQIRTAFSGERIMVRNFYGALKVHESGPATDFDATRVLTNGTINHGEQFLNLARRDLPITYYGPGTGISLAILEKQKQGAIRIGVIGLGTGTLAAYGRLGDYVRFYEINPLVLKMATTEFTYLADCKAIHDVAMGDARLSLEREAPENFDVIAVDAFTSDSIPVHLLTREAMDLYFRHLSPKGILGVHISNRYLDLQPVLAGETAATGRVAQVVDNEDDDTSGVFGATWVLIARSPDVFDNEIMRGSKKIAATRKVRLWTDDYSNLFQILK